MLEADIIAVEKLLLQGDHLRVSHHGQEPRLVPRSEVPAPLNMAWHAYCKKLQHNMFYIWSGYSGISPCCRMAFTRCALSPVS